jgi:light-regulated signal transduction histidine kinase (bacteriophytochrome)/ActR/RegA family two-component response regulator
VRTNDQRFFAAFFQKSRPSFSHARAATPVHQNFTFSAENVRNREGHTVGDGYIISGNGDLAPPPDLSQCEREAIHIPGAIQPHGALLALLAHDGTITHASANLGAMLGYSAETVLGRKFHDVFDAVVCRALHDAQRADASAPERLPIMAGPGGTSLHLHARRTGPAIIVDIEPVDTDAEHALPVTLLPSVLEKFKHAASTTELCRLAVDGLKSITGYDRVIAYRFGLEGHGEVVAEALEPGLAPYLGLTYPASDIPGQARRQYVRQRVGAVADSAYVPVPILVHLPLDDGMPLDLTHSTLRSVSPVHREYMRNMGTAASLTIGLAHRNELWGLLTCHHASPRAASPQVRAAADMIGQIVSLLLGSLGASQDYGQRLERSASLRALVNRLSDGVPIAESLIAAQQPLLHLVGAEGALLRFGGVSHCIGRTPPPAAAERAATTLLAEAGGVMLAIQDTGLHHPELADCIADGSGALLVPLVGAAGDAILWFRPEARATITWAGSPHEHAILDPTSGMLSPRTSFSAWPEKISGRATPWTEMDLAFAREVQSMIEARAVQHSKAAAAAAQAALETRTRDLEVTNTKLEELTRHLAHARDQAEQAVQSKSRFLAGMSHALRTPLNGILGYAQLLRLEGRLDTTQAQRVNSMLDAGQQLLEMINRVLELTEVEAAHTKLNLTAVDIHAVAITCLSVVRYAAESKGLKLRISHAAHAEAHGNPVLVTADPTRLRQVLLNLLDNAIKFTETGWVELRLCSAAEGRQRIEIADTGPGMPAEMHRQVFEEFRRLNSASSLIAGAGVGLAIAARLLMLMGGDLGYEDKAGGGSVFWLHLPLAASADGGEADVASEPAPPAKLRLLVVDDIDMNRDIASAFLTAGGHDVTCAESGEEAVAAVEAADFDVVLMDVCMPGMDGLEATRRIRALRPPRAGVPIVALTAQVFAEQIEECRNAGMNSHLAKPFAYDTLLDAVAQAAGRA